MIPVLTQSLILILEAPYLVRYITLWIKNAVSVAYLLKTKNKHLLCTAFLCILCTNILP